MVFLLTTAAEFQEKKAAFSVKKTVGGNVKDEAGKLGQKSPPGTPNNYLNMDGIGDFKPISYVKIGNHPIETTIYKWLLGVPGRY